MKKITIIEDEPTIVAILSELLKDEGYAVDTAFNGKDGLKILKESPPDLVLLDLNMPKVSGKRVVDEMRRDPSLIEVPVIIVTGSEPDIANFPEEGSYQKLITKPFDIFEILEAVNIYINSYSCKVGNCPQ